MINLNEYIEKDQVKRTKIARDISSGKINKNDLEKIKSNRQIRRAYIGRSFSKKLPQKEWNESYLETLTYSPIAEAFNDEYLDHLNEVAEYVHSREFRNKQVKIVKYVIITLFSSALGVTLYKIVESMIATLK